MKIAIIGATGMVGREISAEALRRGHLVTAASRSGKAVESAPEATAVSVELGDAAAVSALAQANDAVVLATGPSRTGGDHQQWLAANRTALEAIGEVPVLLIGGAGSLLVKGKRLVDDPAFPEAYRQEALTLSALLEELKEAPERLNWTMISPSPLIAPGQRTGNYTLGLDSPAGEKISSQDFAVAILDEIEKPQHQRRRFTAAS
ncbi:NAD(P)-dependent oxidoreductase [Psychromicrobium sp. YIM B11713]|uniref:NAD(P)-dependent oxidoreductase n=1 Tax=Psychromicrobium sp. YIM B11713 TaxID=3145233 RepID=UPI00374E2925